MTNKCGCGNCRCGTFVDNQVNESVIMPITDNMGREIFWEDMGRPNGNWV